MNWEYELAILFHHVQHKPGIRILPVLMVKRGKAWAIERFSGMPNLKNTLLDQFSPEVQQALLRLEGGKEEFLTKLSDRSKMRVDISDSLLEEEFNRFYWSELNDLWPVLCNHPHIFDLHAPAAFKTVNMNRIVLSGSKPVPEFYVYREGKKVIIRLKFSIDGRSYDACQVSPENYFMTVAENQYCLLNDYEHVKLFKQYKNGSVETPFESRARLFDEIVTPLKKKYKVSLHPNLELIVRKIEPEPFVSVAEYLNQYLMMIPHYSYEGQVVAYDDKKELTGIENGVEYAISRDIDFEKAFYEKLRPLHPGFARQLRQGFFYVPFRDVMKGSWLLKTIRKLQEDHVQLRGLENLKKFKHSTKVPKFQMSTSSGIDWFELKISFNYEKTRVPLKDIQAAILSGEKMVVLQDGSFGVLPEDWIAQFAGVLRMGVVKGDILRLDKRLFYLLQDAEVHIREEKVLGEIHAKKAALLAYEEVESAPVSSHIMAELRPYQTAGFQWMQSLDHLGWGGCLADDMGLGKTLQTISFLQFIKEKYPESCSLVVCPTSLLYNWEEELKKFAPSFKYFIYYGQDRNFSAGFLNQYDVIITSYGTVRNDIDELRKHTFKYVVLDESQTIKNPEARVTRACLLLNSANRLILSGTPVQNNTFDLYAQMNFLNPGFLGTKNAFKNHFAIPIDRNHDKDVAQRLRKMTAPFILRRTKEKVAADLPDKSEIIMWCHMKEQQREVYEQYKNHYRSQLLGKINRDGVKKSSFEILEGLTRLRQICDSPALIRNAAHTTEDSTKIRELMREMNENTGEHKILIFSQFTKMLELIREELMKTQIKHVYLDGKTPGKTRMESVKSFQEDASIKAFLISLKAGGVGLNLTAADYVYLVDPWWNPSVESQAIDRSHRIGQTQKVFAYKMICKDSIEEKILELQQKKKSLSKELIREEASFVSKLTKEDIEYLFR